VGGAWGGIEEAVVSGLVTAFIVSLLVLLYDDLRARAQGAPAA